MKHFTEYQGHKLNIVGKKEPFDNTIYTFDIETTSFIILYGKQLSTDEYLNLSEKEKEDAIFMSNMYIWTFSVNDTVYYGRTWEEFKTFLDRLEYFTKGYKKFVFVHNLSYEFQFLRNIVEFDTVFSRKSRKLIYCSLLDYNITFRCSYMMSNLSLENLAKVYNLDTKKLVGNLDYTIPRNSLSRLSEEELAYCENDCLVVYEYIKLELNKYKNIKKIPVTATGHVRKELRNYVYRNFKYHNKVRKAINTNGHVFNLLQSAFCGGYTHSNWIYTRRYYKKCNKL